VKHIWLEGGEETVNEQHSDRPVKGEKVRYRKIRTTAKGFVERRKTEEKDETCVSGAIQKV